MIVGAIVRRKRKRGGAQKPCWKCRFTTADVPNIHMSGWLMPAAGRGIPLGMAEKGGYGWSRQMEQDEVQKWHKKARQSKGAL